VGALAVGTTPALALDPYGVPAMTCGTSGLSKIELKVCGDATTGAPAGITIQWKTLADYQLNGWSDNGLCALSLSGQPSMQHEGKSRWELDPGECETIVIGDINFDETGVSGNCNEPLECGTTYVFRVFAHAGRRMGRSDFSENLTCTTLACEDGCTLTQGYWKTHGPTGCATGNNTNQWSLASLTLGTVNYTDLQACSIFNEAAAGNGLIALAHQLMAAKLNIANGADGTCVSAAINAADALIGNLVVPPVGAGFLSPASTGALINTLASYNEGSLCTGHCASANIIQKMMANQMRTTTPTDAKKQSWGSLKIIYR
jgi:hypothetical protein